MLSIEATESPDKGWNKRLLDSNLGTIYQTKEWAAYLSSLKQEPLFMKFIGKKGEIVGQLLVSKVLRLKNKRHLQSLLKNVIKKKSLITWSYGPITFDVNFNSTIYSDLFQFLLKQNSSLSGSQHPLAYYNVSSAKFFKIIKWSTFLIDLRKPLEILYKNIEKHSGQKNIERSIERGVTIEEITEKNLEEYVNLSNETHDATGREPMTLEQMTNFWRTLKPLGYSGLLAKKDGITVGCILFSFFNNFIIEGGIIRSEQDKIMKYYSQDLLKWKIIEWGTKNSMTFYNLAGFNPEPANEKEKGIFRYKAKWGGDRVDYFLIRS